MGGKKTKKELDSREARIRMVTPFGGLAQLGERIAGSDEVIGSNPLSSTKTYRGQLLRDEIGLRDFPGALFLRLLYLYAPTGFENMSTFGSARAWTVMRGRHRRRLP